MEYTKNVPSENSPSILALLIVSLIATVFFVGCGRKESKSEEPAKPSKIEPKQQIDPPPENLTFAKVFNNQVEDNKFIKLVGKYYDNFLSSFATVSSTKDFNNWALRCMPATYKGYLPSKRPAS